MKTLLFYHFLTGIQLYILPKVMNELCTPLCYFTNKLPHRDFRCGNIDKAFYLGARLRHR